MVLGGFNGEKTKPNKANLTAENAGFAEQKRKKQITSQRSLRSRRLMKKTKPNKANLTAENAEIAEVFVKTLVNLIFCRI